MFDIVNKIKYYPAIKREECPKAEVLPPGIYNFLLERSLFMTTPCFEKADRREGLIDIKTEPFNSIKKAITRFLLPRSLSIYSALKMRHFLGILLYGPPGTGKTCFIEILSQLLVERYGIIIIKIPTDRILVPMYGEIVELARDNPTQPVALVVEEFDGIASKSYGVDPKLLTFMDGSETPENVIFIGTTNHFDRLPANLTARHSRFGIVARLDSLPNEGVESLLTSIIPEELKKEIPLVEMVEAMAKDPITVDEIKSVLLGVTTQGHDVTTALKMIKERKELTQNDEDDD